MTYGNSKLDISGDRLKTLEAHPIGTTYGGGIVFYTWDYGRHGLISSTVNLSGNTWGCKGTYLGTIENNYIGIGKVNTNIILAGCPTSNIAARIATGYTGGGFTDWFLPSQGELMEMKKFSTLNFYSGTNFYLTSNEVDLTANTNVWAYRTAIGDMSPLTKDWSLNTFVKPIREF